MEGEDLKADIELLRGNWPNSTVALPTA